MRRVLQILFLLFYVASSYAVSQERISLVVSKIQHAATGSHRAEIAGGSEKLTSDFPNYRQAKPKTIGVFQFGQNQLAHLLPQVSERTFHLQTYSLKSLHSTESVLSRAPPFQS